MHVLVYVSATGKLNWRSSLGKITGKKKKERKKACLALLGRLARNFHFLIL